MALIHDPFVLDLRGTLLDCRPGSAHVMGVLNVTPDSFSDGGDFFSPDAALRRAEVMAREGARLIDVGGASSRPSGKTYGRGAELVDPAVEMERVVPVVRAIARELPGILISVDTFHAAVGAAVLDAGAHLINDITRLRHEPALADLVASAGAGLALMHSVGLAGQMPHSTRYDDVVGEVAGALLDSVRTARDAGVQSILTDPGFGFGKSPADNLKLIGATDRFVALGFPVMVGVSRKSSIGIALGGEGDPAPVDDRLFGSLGATATAVMRGASVVRTHDVRETVEMIRVLTATMHT